MLDQPGRLLLAAATAFLAVMVWCLGLRTQETAERGSATGQDAAVPSCGRAGLFFLPLV
jgi:hypothetical protein